jgi:dynein-related subfamily AAA family protein
MKFTGTKDYVATDDLKVAVNASIVLERPLLIKGEPGTGKTVLAEEVAKALNAPLLTWHIKSTTKAQQGLYEYDAVSRLRDSQLGDARVSDIKNYIKRGKLWEAFTAEQRPVLLIDAIDKADIEFPNDLLLKLDRMEFHVYETGRRSAAHLLRGPRGVRPEEEAVHVRASGLAQAAAQRRHERRAAARARAAKADPAAARRAAQERAGRASVRAAGIPRPARVLAISRIRYWPSAGVLDIQVS